MYGLFEVRLGVVGAKAVVHTQCWLFRACAAKSSPVIFPLQSSGHCRHGNLSSSCPDQGSGTREVFLHSGPFIGTPNYPPAQPLAQLNGQFSPELFQLHLLRAAGVRLVWYMCIENLCHHLMDFR